MTIYSTTISYGGVAFYVRSITPRKEARTKKQVIAKVLVECPVMGYATLQKHLSISGVLVSATLNADRTALEALDDGSAHAYVDGYYDDNYIIAPGGLTFTDSEGTYGQYNFTLELVEE